MSSVPLNVSERPFITLVKLLLWVFWGIVLYFMIQIRSMETSASEDALATDVFLIGFGLIWLASTLTMAQYVIARGPVLSVSDVGFSDRRVFTKPIPWSEVVGVEAKGKVLKMTVKQPYRFRWLAGVALSVLPFLRGLFATGRYELPLAGLDKPADDIVAAVKSSWGK
ncbi:MAG: hypothetical protein JNK21_16745 [Rhodospirillaceae bacterium]|nr:hypothetical protein [Rhodospirillaceae bacterium]